MEWKSGIAGVLQCPSIIRITWRWGSWQEPRWAGGLGSWEPTGITRAVGIGMESWKMGGPALESKLKSGAYFTLLHPRDSCLSALSCLSLGLGDDRDNRNLSVLTSWIRLFLFWCFNPPPESLALVNGFSCVKLMLGWGQVLETSMPPFCWWLLMQFLKEKKMKHYQNTKVLLLAM